MNTKTIALLYNTTHYVIKFRLPLITALQKAGYRVVVIAPKDHSTPLLMQNNVEFVPIGMSQYGMNPAAEIRNFFEVKSILDRIRPLVSLNYTVKPNTFGSMAAEYAGVPVINNIAGAGMIYTSDKKLQRFIVSALYRRGLRKSRVVFFQNGDDMELFLKKGLVTPEQCLRLPGSGVDLQRYKPSLLPENVLRFVFIGRLLKLKGIKEYLLAANNILNCQAEPGRMEFHIIGEHEKTGAFIEQEQLNALTAHTGIHYHGAVEPDCIGDYIRNASCVVLPTYYGEGVPRVLLEALASARPIITTDSAGSRDVIEHERNGFMVKPRDVDDLTTAMVRFINTTPEKRTEMGLYGRQKAEREFDESIVIDSYLEQIRSIERTAAP